jgi:hypothetical protein
MSIISYARGMIKMRAHTGYEYRDLRFEATVYRNNVSTRPFSDRRTDLVAARIAKDEASDHTKHAECNGHCVVKVHPFSGVPKAGLSFGQ